MVKILYSPRETNLLLSLIKKYEVAIYNKRTDNRSNRRKDAAWEAVTEKFNASSNVTKRTKMQLRKKWENMRTEYKRQLKKANVKKKNIINEPNLVKNTNHDKNATVTSPERVDFDNDSASNTFDTFDEEESLEYTSELNTTYSNTSYTSNYKNFDEYSKSQELTTPLFLISDSVSAELQPHEEYRSNNYSETVSIAKSTEMQKLKSLHEFRLHQEEELYKLKKKKLQLKIKLLEEKLELKKFKKNKITCDIQNICRSPEFVDITRVYPQ